MSNSSATHIEYADTRRFSTLVLDYLSDHEDLKPFFTFRPDLDGLKKAVGVKTNSNVDRKLLVDKWEKEYKNLPVETAVLNNIRKLNDHNTYTICTAHQPNIFTGPIYFVYKIQHAIKLAEELKVHCPDFHFVPVYYMGSEDADLNEIGTVFFHGRRFTWNTKQTGAVGRMKVDDAFIELMNEMELLLKNNGQDLNEIAFFRRHYKLGVTISQATFGLVHELFGKQGLLVFDADDSICKKKVVDIFESDLYENKPYGLVSETIDGFPAAYSIQTKGRPINLFYLYENIRSRIDRNGDFFEVQGTSFRFSLDEMRTLLENHPERFSPNVILRPLLQERLLPNVAFVGGGSELAYWMELKNMFRHYDISFPVLMLRNSFTVLHQETLDEVKRLNLELSDLFKDDMELDLTVLEKNGIDLPNLTTERESLNQLYAGIQHKLLKTEKSLHVHTDALRHKAEKKLIQLEKKLIRVEKKKYASLFLQVIKMKDELFPQGVLQERVENYFSLQIKYGPALLQELYKFQSPFSSAFCMVTLNTHISSKKIPVT